MARLIDADELSKNVYAWARDGWNAELLPYWVKEDIEVMIESAPTVDAVEVVRCKDCIFINECLLYSSTADKNGYCVLGERREDD